MLYERVDWPEYQFYMNAPWFQDEAVFGADHNCFFIPKHLIDKEDDPDFSILGEDEFDEETPWNDDDNFLLNSL